MFKALTDQTCIKMPGDINGIDFQIKDLENCTVILLDHTAQIQVDRCKNTKFYFGPIKSSLFIRNCEDCELTVCCSQFRCRDITNCKIWLYCVNDPIVESSSALSFAPYNLQYPQLEEHAIKADLVGTFKDDEGVTQKRVNKWNLVFDFTKNEDGPANFGLMGTDNFSIVQAHSLVESVAESDWQFELPIEFGGTLDSSCLKETKDGLMLFDIKTGQKQAE